MARPFDLFETAKKELDSIAPLLSNDYTDKKRFQSAIRHLQKFQNIFKKKLIVKLSNGKRKPFQSFRVQHNDSRGLFVGCVAFSSKVSESDVKGHALLNSVQAALLDIPFGGSFGGVAVDLHKTNDKDLQRISKMYAQYLSQHIGTWKDVVDLVGNRSQQISTWMLDAYEKKKKMHSPATFTGKPVNLGGSLGKSEAVGTGAYYILQEYLKKENLIPRFRKMDVAVIGFENDAYNFAKMAVSQGLRIVAIADREGGVVNSNGFDIEELKNLEIRYGSLKEVSLMTKIEAIKDSDLLKLPIDVLAIASTDYQIDSQIAETIKAKSILEISNFSINSEISKILHSKNIKIIPSIISNAGNMIVSHLEWVQNIHGYRWGREDVNSKMRSNLIRSFNEIRNIVVEKKVTYKEAGYYLGVKRLIDAMMLRGRV